MSDWNDEEVNEKTYRLYSKKVPAKKASKEYAERVKRCVNRNEIVSCIASDMEKPRGSHCDWYPASTTSIDQIELQKKEPTELLFFKGAQYEFTFNKEDSFSQSQMAILYDLPSSEDVSQF